MDTQLQKALEFSNFMKTLSNQRRSIEERFRESLIYFQDGHQFTVDNNLINYVNFLISRQINDGVIFVDDNNVPVKILDLNKFLENLLDVYFQALNRYYVDYNNLKQNRSIEKLVEYE